MRGKSRHFVRQLDTHCASPFSLYQTVLDISWEGNNNGSFSSCYQQHHLVLVFHLQGAILSSHVEQVAVQKLCCCCLLGRWIPMCNCPSLITSHNILLLSLSELGPSENQSGAC